MGIHKKEYALLIEESKEMLYRLAYGYLGNETQAIDALDEAVYLGFIHRKELREITFAKTWLTRILIHECYRLLNRQKREVVTDIIPEYTNEDIHDDEYDNLPLKEAVKKLPDELRKVIALRYFGGYTIAETAVILDIPDGTVATRTRKALSLLKVELED
ncbi:MAG: polymerase sigma factor, sigma-70 family [Anaerocolumna sp.]|jgi:RNA polymerase sigma-70 factor (ECF subfamily)|nr:polymerase sigma factor, sigma-70 family [Anaerocolumna sp.]